MLGYSKTCTKRSNAEGMLTFFLKTGQSKYRGPPLFQLNKRAISWMLMDTIREDYKTIIYLLRYYGMTLVNSSTGISLYLAGVVSLGIPWKIEEEEKKKMVIYGKQ